MTLYTTSKDIADMFETIESASDQEEAIRSYLLNNAGLRRFIRWYNSFDGKIADKVDYSRESPLRHPVKLVTLLGDLESVSKYPEHLSIKLLSSILAKVDDRHMMLLENCLTNDLRVYYPTIDWDIFKQYGCEVRDAA